MTTKIKELQSEIELLAMQRSAVDKAISAKQAEIKTLKTLDKVKNGGIEVTSHALERWIERMCGININEIKAHISDQISSMYIGDGKYVKDDNTFVVKNGKIVTVYGNED